MAAVATSKSKIFVIYRVDMHPKHIELIFFESWTLKSHEILSIATLIDIKFYFWK